MNPRRQRGHAAFRSGVWAETLAVLWLRLKGYRILERRLRTHAGEIDIVAQRPFGPTCFIEVKTRPTPTAAVAAISANQRRRIERAAGLYMARMQGRTARFDVVCIVPNRLPRHIPDAWRP